MRSEQIGFHELRFRRYQDFVILYKLGFEIMQRRIRFHQPGSYLRGPAASHRLFVGHIQARSQRGDTPGKQTVGHRAVEQRGGYSAVQKSFISFESGMTEELSQDSAIFPGLEFQL